MSIQGALRAMQRIEQRAEERGAEKEREKIAACVIAARDASIAGDHAEVFHQLYKIADPTFTNLEPWAEMESLVRNGEHDTIEEANP